MTTGGHTLTRLAPLGTLSRTAGERLVVARIKFLSRGAGEGGPSPLPFPPPRAVVRGGGLGWGLVGEGLR
jgi:hypothetical protein